MTKKSNRSSAFTLVEMLVVIAIIGVLMSMLLPSLKTARESARLLECATRQKQIYYLCMAYRQDQKQYYPACHYYDSNNPSTNMVFGYAIQPYIPSGMANITSYAATPRTNLLRCPNDKLRWFSPGFTAAADAWPHVYAGNALVIGYNVTMQFGGGNDISWTSAANKLRYRPRRETPFNYPIAFLGELAGSTPYIMYTGYTNIKFNHNEGKSTNVLMSDGVVKSFHEDLAVAAARPASDGRKLVIW